MDRRSRKTRAQLMHAMLHLMQTNSWEAVTVQEICDAADIARSTFYLHFSGKADLLDYAFRHLGEEMRAEASNRSLDKDGQFAILPALVRMMSAAEHAFLFNVDRASESSLLAQGRLRGVIQSEFLAELLVSKQYASFPARKLAFIASGVFGILEAAHKDQVVISSLDLLGEIDGLVGALLKY